MLFTFSYIYIYIDFCLFLFFSTIIKIFSVLNLTPSQGVLNPKSTNLIPKPTTVAQPHPHVDKSPNLLYIRLLLHIKLIPVKKQSFKLLAASSIEKNVLQLTPKLKTRCNLYELSLPSSSFYQPPIPLPKTVSLKRKWSFLTLLSYALIKKYSYFSHENYNIWEIRSLLVLPFRIKKIKNKESIWFRKATFLISSNLFEN